MRSFARKTGLSDTFIHKLLSGTSEPTLSSLQRIASACGVTVPWLIGEDQPTPAHTPEHSAREPGIGSYQFQSQSQWLTASPPAAEPFDDRFALVPLYDVRVSAGHGAFNGTENVLTQLAFTRYWLNKLGLHAAHLAAVRVDGDSMEPTIRSGDVLLIDREQTQLRDGVIYVMRREELLVAKRLQLLAGGRVRVISDNQTYPPEEVEPAALEILGRAVWKGGPL